VEVLDAAPQPGGLAAGFRDPAWEWSIEHFYHHLFTSDADILGLVRETGFEHAVVTRRPVTAQFYRGRAHALDGVLPVLRFAGIPFPDRVRMGLAIGYLKVNRDWRALENVTAHDWVRRWMGEAAYQAIWEPLLAGKFGAHAETVPMSWLWARLHKRSQRLIYFAGGFQAFADHLAAEVRAAGAAVRLATPVAGIRRADGGGLALAGPHGEEAFDRVIVTTGPQLLARLAPELPAGYLAALNGLPFLGAIVAVLALDRPLMERVYWLSLDKREFPFLACVEHTNFVDPAHYGGQRLVYVGDYLPPGHRNFGLSDEGLLDAWLPALRAINPAFRPGWVQGHWVHRASYAQPVVSLGFSARIPELRTPLPGLYLASMSQVYPWDRGTNYAVAIGRRAAGLVVEDAAGLAA
jgi:protoporphyrinogen oxidase